MLRLLFCLPFLFLLCFCNAQTSWVRQNSGTSGVLSYVGFIDDNVGIVTGGSGVILRTADGGNTWVKINSGTTGNLSSVCFVNSNLAFISGDNGLILKSTDVGNTWIPLNTGVSNVLYSVDFVDSNVGYATGMGGIIIKTTNGGTTWSQKTSSTSYHTYHIDFLNKDTGFVAAQNGVFARTYDGGNTWTTINTGSYNDFSYVHFYDKNIGFITGDYGTILKTIDGGNTWTTLNSGVNVYLNNIQFIDNATDYVVGVNGTILKTSDAGLTWNDDNSGVSDRLVSVCFPSPNVGYAVGLNGCIIKSKPNCTGPIPKVSLGNDTSYCGSFTRQLDVGISGSYLWSTRETTLSISINSAGKFSVKIITPSNCIVTDTIVVNQYVNPILSIGKDTSYCGSFNRTLDAGIQGSYLWSTNERTKSINVSSGGKYYVKVTSSNNCVGADTIIINQFSKPLINLGNDTIYCGSFTRTLDSEIPGNYLWSTNETTRSITVNSANNYFVKVVSSNNNCIVYDTIKIDQFLKPFLGEDTTICTAFNIHLDAGKHDFYSWSNGSFNQVIDVNNPGKYYVEVKDGSCTTSDTINILTQQSPQIAAIDTTINNQITIYVQNGTSPFRYSIDGLHFQNEETFSNLSPGDYLVTIKDKLGCFTSQAIKLYEDVIIIPNFFTPNEDGIHDTWEIKGIQSFPYSTIQIYDRFGKLLIVYNGLEHGWDGSYNKFPMKSDDYWYVITLNPGNKSYKGHVTLIR